MGFDELAAVEPCRTLYQARHDAARHTLAIADDGSLGLRTEVANQEHAMIDAAQFLQQGTHGDEQRLAALAIGDDGVYHVLVTLGNLAERLLISGVALHGQLRCPDEFVGNASKGGDNNNYGLRLSLYYLFNT